MRSVAGAVSSLAMVGVLFALIAPSGSAADRDGAGRKHPRVRTDGRLRPGHLELIRVAGFPGRGVVEVSFFPTAICEDSCGARSFSGGRTDASGAARFRVRVPGTFFDHRNRPVYFRNRERVEVTAVWEGPGPEFAIAEANPQPMIVRTHRAARD